jgi:hypothetical protein
MIFVQLSGGLGNQMFQYAFGQSVGKKRNVSVVYKPDFEGLLNRKFELHHFGISGMLADDRVYESMLKMQQGLLTRIRNRFLPYYRKTLIVEKQYHFDPNLLHIPRHCLVNGYFQSEKYFADIASHIRHEFRLKTPLTPENEILVSDILNLNSVSLHVRRGDYLEHPLFPTYGVAYYQKAIELILQLVKDPVFYIFSNDIKWCRENLEINHPAHFVTINNEQQPHYDLYLMSKCKHNIVANSSFSWWSAWLNNNPGKTVVAPSKWVNQDSGFFANISDIIPKAWIQIQP